MAAAAIALAACWTSSAFLPRPKTAIAAVSITVHRCMRNPEEWNDLETIRSGDADGQPAGPGSLAARPCPA